MRVSEHYSHLLIPEDRDAVPLPSQIVSFLDGLLEQGSAPREASSQIGKHTGKVRTCKDAITGKVLFTVPVREFFPMESVRAIADVLDGLEDYTLRSSGKGPPERLLFELYLPSAAGRPSEIQTEYYYEVDVHLREASVAMSEGAWLKPCVSQNDEGIFRNPWNNGVIKVPRAACARFWIEFMFGNWLAPKIDKTLELLPPRILTLANESFGTTFAQGCHFA